MTLCLLAICLVCSGLLAGVYALTKGPIDAASKAKNEAAIKEVLPETAAVIDQEKTIDFDGASYTYNLAFDEQGNTVGCAVNVAPVGFGGPIVIKVGFKVDAATGAVIVWNTKVLSHAETPGLGAKCSDPAFADQFRQLDPATKTLGVKKDGGDIDAITASTITSRAFVSGVATAAQVVAAIAGTPMLIDTATGASSTDWTAPVESNDTPVILNDTPVILNDTPVILNDSEGSVTK